MYSDPAKAGVLLQLYLLAFAMQPERDQQRQQAHAGNVPEESVLHAERFQRQRDIFRRTAEQGIRYRIRQAYPNARTSGGNISALSSPLIAV